MTARTVITWPDSRLLKETDLVIAGSKETAELAQDLYHTMIVSFGAGLAAPQVGIHKSVCIISSAYAPSLPKEESLDEVENCVVLVNPSVSVLTKEKFRWEEACLSVPDLTASIERHQKIRLRYENLSGDVIEKDLEGIESATVQHETDHLIGKLFIHRLTGVSRQSAMRKLRSRILAEKKKNTHKIKKKLHNSSENNNPSLKKRIQLRKKRKKQPKSFGKNKR